MMYSSKLPYGLRIEGNQKKLIHISEITPSEYGLRCNCVCPSCGVSLQAKLPRYKEDYTPRFTHHNADTCDYATETALHLKAKEIIEAERTINLPEVIAEYKGLTKQVYSVKSVTFETVVLEKWIENIRPDIFAYKGKTPLIIEIKYSHGIDSVKLEKIKKHGISTLEIDLSDMEDDFNPEELKDRIINNTEHKSWIFNQHAENEMKNLKDEYLLNQKNKEKKLKKSEEKRKRQEKIENDKRNDKVERIKKLLESSKQIELRKKWAIEFTSNPIWIETSNATGISIDNIPKHLDIEIPGDIVFGCDRRMWQSYIFYKYIFNKEKRFGENAYPISVDYMYNHLKSVFNNHIIKDLVYQKDIEYLIRVPDLTKVIYDYLMKLVANGFLFNPSAERNIYYTKFQLFKPPIFIDVMRHIPKQIVEYDTMEELVNKKRWNDCKEFLEFLIRKYNENEYSLFNQWLTDALVVLDQGMKRL